MVFVQKSLEGEKRLETFEPLDTSLPRTKVGLHPSGLKGGYLKGLKEQFKRMAADHSLQNTDLVLVPSSPEGLCTSEKPCVIFILRV